MNSLPDEEVKLPDCQVWWNQVLLLVQISNSCLWGFLYYHLYKQKLSQTTEFYHGQNEPHSYSNTWSWPVWLCINWRGYLLSGNMKEWEEKSCIVLRCDINICLVNPKNFKEDSQYLYLWHSVLRCDIPVVCRLQCRNKCEDRHKHNKYLIV